MRLARLAAALLLASSLVACGSDPDDGSGGTGGTGGSGGGGWTGRADCRGLRVLDLNGDASGRVSISDAIDTVDNWTGSCLPADTVGNDVAVAFRAPEAGHYLFSTAGTAFDTVLYAFRDCEDGFSELACNDDAGGTEQSRILVEMQAGEEIFVVVDSVNLRQSAPFELSVERVEPSPPVIESMEAFANSQVRTAGVRITGVARFPIAGYSLMVWDTRGVAMLARPLVTTLAELPLFRVQQDGEAFVFEGSFYMGPEAPVVGAIEIGLIDEVGLESEKRRADAGPPRVVGRGEPCDRNLATAVCDPADACLDRETEGVWVCSVATPPTISEATASRNLETMRFGLVIRGSDAERDIRYARILPRGASGPLSIDEGGVPTLVPFHHLYQDPATGEARGVVSIPARFDGPCMPPAVAMLQDCLNRGGSSSNCQRAATDFLVDCYEETLGEVTSVEVELVDIANRVSETLVVSTIGEATDAGAGEVCDPWGAIAACPQGYLCWAEETEEAEICREEGPASCPDSYGAIDLNARRKPKGHWEYRGNSAASTKTYGPFSCGGGGPSDLFAFTAPEAGRYRIETSRLGVGVDTLIAVRPYCQLAAYELGCNDDGNPITGTPSSRLEVELAADETVYIFVDSYVDPNGNAYAGEYTLTVTRR